MGRVINPHRFDTAGPAYQTPARVQGAAGTATATTATATLAAPATAGNLLVISANGASQVPTLVSAGYTNVGVTPGSSTGSNDYTTIWHKVAVGGELTGQVLTTVGGVRVTIDEYSGATDVHEVTPTTASTGASSMTALTIPSGGTGSHPVLLHAVMGPTSTFTSPAWSNLTVGASGTAIFTGWGAKAAGSWSTQATWTTGRRGSAGLVAFRAKLV